MTTTRPPSFAPVAAPQSTSAAVSTRRRERDFGAGYGRSSGHAAARRYTVSAALPQFRLA